MIGELQQLKRFSDLVVAGESHGYDHSLMQLAIVSGFVDPHVSLSCESTQDNKDADEVRAQYAAKVAAHQKEYDSKLDGEIAKANARIKKVRQSRQKMSEEFDEAGQKFTTVALGLLTGCMHAVSVVDKAVRDARHVVTVETNRQGIQAGTRSFFAKMNLNNQVRLNAHVDRELGTLRGHYANLVDISRSNSAYKNTAAYQHQVNSMKNMAGMVGKFREASAKSTQQSEKVLGECEKVLSGLQRTRKESLDLASKAAMPLWRKVGIFALLITIHMVLWFIVTKVILTIVHWYERRALGKK